ncbi:GNAT family N-acetyltransferase [Aquihabitans sp. G128]|uniref:GNAT family N-acetyltransferase n=1 Tax=Aquihabitans sp. G128 TaxID=2849779 RepID=UPI001C21845B|nr:GNAT family N-acetyltransferase [Aquihabitans sp. G128]QXC59874.1 GNAT family N-acetyltransferase [Aquihabitans sp. G128]
MEPLPLATASDCLVVRAWAPDEAPALHAAVVASTEHLRPWMPWIAHEPLAVEERRAMIEGWRSEAADGGDVVYGMWAEGAVVGGCGLHRRLGPGGVEIGYWVHADHVGRGVATEASRLLTELAFTVADIEVVEVHHDVANAASARVPEKLGFVRVADISVPAAEPRAPAETGRRGVWRTTRQTWRG